MFEAFDFIGRSQNLEDCDLFPIDIRFTERQLECRSVLGNEHRTC